jgi:hypothetical protein
VLLTPCSFLVYEDCSVADRYSFDVDQDPDPTFHFDADPDPDPYPKIYAQNTPYKFIDSPLVQTCRQRWFKKKGKISH